jgi:Zn-dependent protease with chaperone function
MQEAMESAQQAVMGLAVLAAIPVVLFALWAEYFNKYIDTLEKHDPKYDRKLELDRAKMASTCVLLFEVVLFVGSMDVLKIYPKFCVGTLTLAIVFLGISQAGIERKLKPLPTALSPDGTPVSATTNLNANSHATSNANGPATPAANGANAFRALLFAAFGGFSYVLTLLGTVRAFIWVAQTFHFSDQNAALFVMFGAAVGIFAGLLLNFALAPWQMRNSLPVYKMPDGPSRTDVEALFKKIGKSKFEFFIINVDGARTLTALVAGFSFGRGLFQPAVFISKSLMNQLSPAQFKAVIAHEAAHIEHNHLLKRVVMSASLIVALTFVSIFGVLLIHFLFPSNAPDTLAPVEMFFGFISLILTFRTLAKQSRKHESEADWVSVSHYGSSFEDWSSALRKIDTLNGVSTSNPTNNLWTQFFGRGHPDTETRITVVETLLLRSGKLPIKKTTQDDQDTKAA